MQAARAAWCTRDAGGAGGAGAAACTPPFPSPSGGPTDPQNEAGAVMGAGSVPWDTVGPGAAPHPPMVSGGSAGGFS